jgi:transcriptional regulator with XRE-family HTH domain
VNDLLILLGKRVHELRAARNWSQEEFAHISGLHRTYVGQIERGEKNISFANLSKISSVLGVTLSELLSGLEDGGTLGRKAKRKPESGIQQDSDAALRMLEIRKLVRRLAVQRTAMDRSIFALEEIAGPSSTRKRSPAREHLARSRPRSSKKQP